jgi:hypothetical protein
MVAGTGALRWVRRCWPLTRQLTTPTADLPALSWRYRLPPAGAGPVGDVVPAAEFCVLPGIGMGDGALNDGTAHLTLMTQVGPMAD